MNSPSWNSSATSHHLVKTREYKQIKELHFLRAFAMLNPLPHFYIDYLRVAALSNKECTTLSMLIRVSRLV